MKYDVTTIGDVTRDVFVFPAKDEMLPPLIRSGEKFLVFEHGEKISLENMHEDIGGTAGNVAVGLAKLSLKSNIISLVGKDSAGQEVIETLRRSKVDVSHLLTSKTKKTNFSIIISYNSERSILTFHNFSPAEFEIPKNIDTQWLFVGPLADGYKPLLSKITALAAEKNVKIAINPGSAQIKDGLTTLAGLLRVAKVLFVNKEEGRKLAGFTGVTNIKDITTSLVKTGVEIVVVTDGREGAYAATPDDFYKIGPYPAERVEVTGAGDAFAAAFLAGLIHGEKLFTCLEWGVTNSGSVVEHIGAQEGLLGLTTIKRRVREYRWPASSMRFS